MFRCWSPVSVEEENHLPYDDFDPLKEWLVHPDDVQLQNPADLSNTNPDSHELPYSGVKREQKDLILESSIDVNMEKVSLVEISDRGQGEVGLEENGGGSDRDNKCVMPGLKDLKSDLPNKEGIFEGESDEEGSTSVDAQSDNGDSSSDESSDESMSVAKSLSSSEDEDDVGMKSREEAEEFEEGEVREFDTHGIDFLSDEEGQGPKGPIRSKHEEENLPPVPMVEVTLQPNHQLWPVGVISSIMSNRVIVEGSVLHNPLNEGSILWITDTRHPLGLVDEIFGPVKNPYYVVRYNTEEEAPAGIGVGISISFVAEFATQILDDKALHKKGYDASGDNDEEVDNEVEFSDDEKEAEYKKSLREGKRAINQCKGVKQEARFEKKRNAFMAHGARQHRDIQKQPIHAHLSVDQPHTAHPLPLLSPALCSQPGIGSRSWSSSSAPTNADSIAPTTMPQFPEAIKAVNFPGNPGTPWPPGFSPQLQNTGLQADLPMQLQNQNVFLNNLVNMMAFQHLLCQFVPHQGSTLPWVGAAPSLQPLGQSNIAPSPFPNGFINEQIQGQARLPFDPSMQFNVGSSASSHFNGGNSWSRGRRPYQRGGGGRFFDRGGRQPNR